jgi:hypothetical protein
MTLPPVAAAPEQQHGLRPAGAEAEPAAEADGGAEGGSALWQRKRC